MAGPGEVTTLDRLTTRALGVKATAVTGPAAHAALRPTPRGGRARPRLPRLSLVVACSVLQAGLGARSGRHGAGWALRGEAWH